MRIHHVVYCVRPEHQDRAVQFWKDLGLDFQEMPLVEEGLKVWLAWDGGIEIVSPALQEGTETARFRTFLEERGEGVYSVVMRSDDVDAPIAVAAGYGADVQYQQHREHGDIVVDEAELEPVLGMSVTFLATNIPDGRSDGVGAQTS